jgi:hypothetical protein
MRSVPLIVGLSLLALAAGAAACIIVVMLAADILG